MRISFHTLGCKQNYAETSHIREQFERLGHEIVTFGVDCDVVIINTCTVTDNADVECRKLIRRALRSSPNAFIGVTGCYAQLQPEEIASIDGVDAVFGVKQKFAITTLIGEFEKLASPKIFVDEIDDVEFVDASFSENDSHTRAFLKIQDGCDYSCSFCTIPLARGPSRSMEFREIAGHIRRLEQCGYHEIVITGINTGEYRSSGGERFIDVINLIETLQPSLRIRISSIEPNKVTTDVIDAVAGSNVFCKHFHIPLQSGSPDILRSMRRRYSAEDYAALIRRIKDKMPDAGIGADVITGFPGETDDHFSETLNFLSDIELSYLHVFTYSERENTPASEYQAKVGIVTRRQRTRVLRELSREKRQKFFQSQKGKESAVIPESYDPLDESWSGYTDNYIRVKFAAPALMIKSPKLVVLRDVQPECMGADLLHTIEIEKFSDYIPILA